MRGSIGKSDGDRIAGRVDGSTWARRLIAYGRAVRVLDGHADAQGRGEVCAPEPGTVVVV